MSAQGVSHLKQIADESVEKKWGRNARRQLGDTLYEAVLAREVLLLLMGQALDTYRPAQILVRTAMGWGAHE